jgi:uncharacterized protein involved in response to NO
MADKKIAILALGFRPFYLLAASWSVFAIFEWLLELQGIGVRGLSFASSMQWHAHEMIFGFAATVVTGFALTAVRAWTGLNTPTGKGLLLLVLLWCGARIGAFTGTFLALLDISIFANHCNSYWAFDYQSTDVSQSLFADDIDAIRPIEFVFLFVCTGPHFL